MGGFNGQESLNSVEYYDPASDQWTMVRPMRDRRSGVGVATHRGVLYAAGGFNGTRRLASMERYDPDTDDWRPLPPMLNARSNFAMTMAEDQILVIGGYGGRHTTARVELYDVYNDRWTVSTELSYSRSALSACVVTGLPNVDHYTSRYSPDLSTDSVDQLTSP
ncbi:kelch-like protein 10 [Littorina saxatilis]